jgi:hypothetical protein
MQHVHSNGFHCLSYANLQFIDVSGHWPIDELKIRIRQAVDMLHRVWGELDYRLDICRVTRGAHIEHL